MRSCCRGVPMLGAMFPAAVANVEPVSPSAYDPLMPEVTTRRVGVVGHGAIGSVVAAELAAGRIGNAELAGVGLRDERIGEELPIGPAIGVDELIERSDLVVEAAGQTVFAAVGRAVLTAGCDLLAVSTGALADAAVFTSIVEAGPGRLYLCSGGDRGDRHDPSCSGARADSPGSDHHHEETGGSGPEAHERG